MIGYGSAGALIFSLYIVYDTQLMLGGKHKVKNLDPQFRGSQIRMVITSLDPASVEGIKPEYRAQKIFLEFCLRTEIWRKTA